MGTSNGADASAGAHGQPEAEADSRGVEPTRAAEAAGSLSDPALAGNVEQRSEQVRHELRDETDTGRSGDLDKCPACDASTDVGAPQRAAREVKGGELAAVPEGDAHARGHETRPKGKRFLILFAGRERPHDLRDALRRLGARVDSYEIMDDVDGQDLSRPSVQSIVLAGIAKGIWDGVYVAPPCASFSPALTPRLRSLTEVEGVSPVPARWAAYLEKHNHLARFAAVVADAADKAGAVWLIENPASRRGGWAWWPAFADAPTLWDLPEFVALRNRTAATRVTFAQCQFGAEYQKYTSVMASASAGAALHRVLGGARCGCTSHAKLAVGRDEFGESLSAPSAAYPPALNTALARVLVSSVVFPENVDVPREPLVARELHLGSADPHVLNLDDDKVARSRRAPTFSLQGHTAATTDELRARPVAAMNVAPSTSARAPPGEQLGAFPTVNSISDLLEPIWARRVTAWRRQTRRCIALAGKGDWRAARRMRPADLYVPNTAMRPPARPFEWDLRPWASGGAAVPTRPSSFGGQRGPTSVDVEKLHAEWSSGGLACGFHDEEIIFEVLDGITDDVPSMSGSFLCGPHTGALQHIEIATAKVNAVVEGGWGSAHADLPFWPMRSDPYGIADESARAGKPKFRLTNDHSWPPAPLVRPAEPLAGASQGERGVTPALLRSLNESMDRSGWPEARLPRVHEVAEAAAILQSSGAPVKAAALDAVAYYKQFGRQAREFHRNCAVTADGFIVDERCCFGSAADATKCARVSNLLVYRARKALRAFDRAHPTRDQGVLAWLESRARRAEELGHSDDEIAERWATLFALGMYIDDSGLVSIDDLVFDIDGEPLMRNGVHMRRAAMHFEVLKATMHELGIDTCKEQTPSEDLELLGVALSLREQRMRLATGKRVKYAAMALDVAQRKTVERETLLELLGRLNFAATFYPMGRQWLHAPWRALRAQYRTANGDVVITATVRAQLTRWILELENPEHEGVPFGAARAFPGAADTSALAIYADAALECADAGFCAWTVVDDELVYVQGEWTAEERRDALICDLELAASTFGLVALTPESGRSFVYSFTDNVNAKAAMRSATPKTELMQAFCGARVDWLLANQVAEAAERITSAANLWADLGSRGKLAEMLAQAHALGLSTRRVPVPPGWRAMLRGVSGGPGTERGTEGDRPTPSPTPPLTRKCSPVARQAGGEPRRGGDADRREPLGAAQGIHRSGAGRRPALPEYGRPLVREVLPLRARYAAVHVADARVAAGGEARGGAAHDGLRDLAGDLPAVGAADLCQVDLEVPRPGAAVAPRGVPDGHHRGARPLPAQGGGQGHRTVHPAAACPRPLGRADAGPRQGDRPVPPPAVTYGRQLGSRANDGVLRPAPWRRVRPPGGRDVRPESSPDESGRQVLPQGWRVVCDHPHASGQEGRRYQDAAARSGRRGNTARPRSDAPAPVRGRPGARGADGDDAVVPTRRGGLHGRGSTGDGQGDDGEHRPRPGPIRGPLAAHRRRHSRAGGRALPGGD
jgi:hypothetical protein